MQHEHVKTGVIGTWMLAWSVMALTVNADSAIAWFAVLSLGVVPPLMLLRLWRPPAQTMSESIREALK